MKPVVFLGPSLPRDEAVRLLDGEYRPPIRRGDLAAVPAGSPVLIIDGEFDQSFSVSPREILTLLDRGTPVFGAASMGALRAAELATYGMQGIGWIFESYRSGRIAGDDEVALTFSPIDGTAMTVPLVNVRYWLDHLTERGVLDAPSARRCLRLARSIFYAERTPRSLVALLRSRLRSDSVDQLLASTGGEILDVKREDARLALAHVSHAVRRLENQHGGGR
jgi:hypothetical protein